ncbi:MAG: low molecular weight phosphatase family protein [Bdellovibrio sp. 28-41-41]|nr:MAG: low molecular weight phosphatase family protein [Bdellovibrio sp. 28-41-41]
MKILFMCVANSARSQLAEGLARDIFPKSEIQSAGSNPGKLNPFATQVMKEIGIDISRQYSKSIDDLAPNFIVEINYVITLCAEEVCPIVVAPKAEKLHWPFIDPVPQVALTDEVLLRRFREARDSIRSRLIQLKKEINL